MFYLQHHEILLPHAQLQLITINKFEKFQFTTQIIQLEVYVSMIFYMRKAMNAALLKQRHAVSLKSMLSYSLQFKRFIFPQIVWENLKLNTNLSSERLGDLKVFSHLLRLQHVTSPQRHLQPPLQSSWEDHQQPACQSIKQQYQQRQSTHPFSEYQKVLKLEKLCN